MASPFGEKKLVARFINCRSASTSWRIPSQKCVRLLSLEADALMGPGCPPVRQAGAGSPAVGGLLIGGAGEVGGAARCSSTSLVTAATELPTLSMMAFSESVEIASRRVQARTWVGSAKLILLRIGGCLTRCMAAFPGCKSTACNDLRSIPHAPNSSSERNSPGRRPD
jgi:hypothetical protein